jgi:hypothetical protein
MATSWPCTYSCCVPVGAIRRQSPRSCSARAPASIGSSASIALANWASPSTQTANSPPPCGRRSCCPWCSAHWLRCSRPHLARMAGAVCAGVARCERPNSRPNMGWQSPHGPSGGGSMNWGGCGNAPNSSPKMTIPSGSSAWQSPVMIRHSSKVSTTRNRTLPLCICS